MSDNLYTKIFLIFIVFMSIERLAETFSKREKLSGKIHHYWTFNALMVTHILLVISTIAEFLILKRNVNYFIASAGFLFYCTGLWGRNISIKTLGKYHSVHIELREEHPLISKGLYRFTRHPYYFSVFFEILSFPLIANAFYTLVFASFTYIPLLLIRVRLEEKKMKEKFGDNYLK